MDESRRGAWPQDPEALPDGGTGRAAAGLFEGFVRHACVNGSVLLSLVTLVAGFVTQQAPWMVVGVLVGVPGIVLPWLSVGKKWPVGRMWATVLAVAVADVAVLALMWTIA